MKKFVENYKKISGYPDTKYIFLLFLCVMAAYANVFLCGFVFDDKILIVENQNIKSFRYILDIFGGEFFDTDMRFNSGGYYRPLIVFSFMLEHFIWKLNAAGYHIVNVLLHLGNVICLFYLLKMICRKRKVAFYTALFFGIHPVQTSAVTYISGRTDVMAFLFMLLFLLSGFYWFINYSRSKLLFMSLLFYFLALLCKEVAIIAFVLLFILIFYQDNKFYKLRKSYVLLAGCAVVALLYLLIRGFALNSFKASGGISILENAAIRLAMLPQIIIGYFQIILFPLNLHFERFIAMPESLWAYVFSVKAAGYYTLFACLLFVYYRYSKKFKEIHLFALFYFASFFPALQIVPIIVSGKLFTPEHFLYIPLVAFFSLLFFWLFSLPLKFQKKLKAVLIVLVLICIGLSLKRNLLFKDNITFYAKTLKRSSGSARIYNNLGNAYSDQGLYKKAFLEYQKAIKIDSSYPQTFINLGNLFVRQGLFSKSVPFYLKAVKLKPNDSILLCNIGVLYDKQKKYKQAVIYLKKALALKPNYKEAYDNLGTVYMHAGDYKSALKYYDEALKIDAGFGAAYYHIGNVYMAKGNDSEAENYFKKAISAETPFYEAYNNLGIVLKEQGQKEEALRIYKDALKTDPNNINFLNNMGAVYDEMGEYEKAAVYFRKIIKLAPHDINALYNLGNILLRLKEYKKSKIYLEKAYELLPKDKDVILSLSFLYGKTGKKQKAVSILRKGKALYPKNIEISKNLEYFSR